MATSSSIRAPSFPIALYSMLDEAEEKKFDHIISWMPNSNTMFKIHDPTQFMNTVVKGYFANQTKKKSFLRQLNLYDFHRITESGPFQGAYYHPLFVRGDKQSSFSIKRSKARGGGGGGGGGGNEAQSMHNKYVIGHVFAGGNSMVDAIHPYSLNQGTGNGWIHSSPEEQYSPNPLIFSRGCLLNNRKLNIPEELCDDIISIFGRETVQQHDVKIFL